MSDKTVLVLGASELQLPAIRKAKKMGLNCITVDYDKNAIGAKEADKFYEVSTIDLEGVLEVSRTENIDAIFTICSDRPMQVVAKVGESLNLNTISKEAALLATNKAHMRNALAEGRVGIPQYRICKTFDDYMHAIDEIDFPVIVKPSDNSGSRGISFVDKIDKSYEAYEYAKENSLEGVILVEEYLEGEEVSVEAFVLDGKVNVIQITDKITTGAPHFVEMGHNQPSSHGKDIVEEIKSTTENAIKCLKVTGGPVHAELKITENGIKVVELGARLGGDHISTELVSLSTGIDLVEATINWALGEDVDIKQKISAYSAIRYIGKLSAVKMDREQMELLDYFSWNRLNENDIKSSRDREFCFIVSGETRNIVDHKIDVIRCTIENGDGVLYW